MFILNPATRALLFSAVLCLSGATAKDAPSPSGRYLAVFADGRRVQGDQITGWQEPDGTVLLDQEPLLDPRRPLRWLRDRTLEAWRCDGSTPGCVEFVGGDRLIGQVVGVEPPDPFQPAGAARGLRVQVPDDRRKPDRRAPAEVRVLSADVRRITWGCQPPRPFQPMTLFLTDGKQIPFVSLRWRAGGIQLLLDSGARLVPLADVAELHLRGGDPWEAYYRELAVLCADPAARLVRLETSTGMILTASTARLRVAATRQRKPPPPGFHAVQPAWALDPIWIALDTVRTRWYFDADEVPLSRLAPARIVQRSMTGYAWRPRRNRGVDGGELVAGGQTAGWGLGVHACSELTFPLPPMARSVRTRAGLDASAGAGGCARALIYLGQAKGKPLYRGKLLVGSTDRIDTGELKLPPAGAGGERTLVLVADAAHRDRPRGADPYDIRDSLDWVEPTVRLDPAALRAEVVRRIPAVVGALAGWQAAVAGGGAPVASVWDESDRKAPRFVPVVATAGRRLTLSRRVRIADGPQWLKLHVRQAGPPTAVGCVDVRVGARGLARVPVHHAGDDLPYLVPLDAYRGKEVDLRVVYTPGAPGEGIQWRQLALVDRPTRVHWVPLTVADATARNGARLAGQPDGSILVEHWGDRVSRIIDNYVIRAVCDLPRVTAIRLEALPDSSLPAGGPSLFGGFTLTQFRIGLLPARRTPIHGRYVRVELPQTRRSLSLAEVEVFAPPPDEKALLAKLSAPGAGAKPASAWHKARDILAILRTPPARRPLAQRIALRACLDATAENIARGAKASQSSTVAGLRADLALNGNVRSGFSQTEVQDEPWLEVDLGAARAIDRIVVWNRVELDHVANLRNFDVAVLDKDRREVWRRRNIADAPVPATELIPSAPAPLGVAWAWEAPGESPRATAPKALDCTSAGWDVQHRLGEPHAAVFVLDQPADARGVGLKIELKHGEDRWYRLLGRFRLLATAEVPPDWAEPPATVVRPAAAPGALPAGPAPTSPRALFEDDGHWEAVPSAPAPKASPRLAPVTDDKHAGLRAMRLPAGATGRLALDWPAPIRARPGEGEFRYLRFAIRKYGGGKVSVALEHAASKDRPCRYLAGSPNPAASSARGVWALELPAEWIVVEQDVYQDFGRLDLTGLAFTCEGGGPLMVDHVWVARTQKDFERLPPAPSPKETNEKARRMLARIPIAKGRPAVVSLDADGMPGTGVLVGDKGWVVTAGHLIAGVGDKIKIRTADGKTLAGRAAGIDRETDLGLIRITGKGAPPGVKIADARGFQPNCMYVGFSFAPSYQDGKVPMSYVTLLQAAGLRTGRMDFQLPDAAVGGPLLDSQGQLVGVHNDTIPPGMLQFTQAHGLSLAENWDRLTRGEVWGPWMPEAGPMMGIHTTQHGTQCHLNFVYEQTPAARAGLQAKDILLKVDGQPVRNYLDVGRVLADKSPGGHVTVTVQRGEQTFERKIPLIRRRRFDRETQYRRAH